jgi:hypothetical protein
LKSACNLSLSLSWVRASPPYFLKIYFNFILPSMPRSSKWSLSLRSPCRHLYCLPPVLHAASISFFLNLLPE